MIRIAEHKFWPFRTSASTFAALLLFLSLFAILTLLRAKIGWPSTELDGMVLLGMLAFSVVPVVLALLDLMIARGAALKYGEIELNFSKVESAAMSGLSIPANLGVSGHALNSSSSGQILEFLRKAASCDVAILDLGDGQAWWETRLLILLAGAERLKKPQKILFLGTEGGKPQQFQGWAHPDELLRCLVRSDEQYDRSLATARAVARQWELVEPPQVMLGQSNPMPAVPSWMTSNLAKQQHCNVAFSSKGLPSDLAAEQLLAADLGEHIETKTKPRTISLTRLDELFRPTLIKEYLDQSWASSRQMETFFSIGAVYCGNPQQ